MHHSLKGLIPETRIQAVADVMVKPADRGVVQTMHEHSRNADLVFLGLRVPPPGMENEYADRLCELVTRFRAAVLVRNGGPFAGQLI